MRHDYGKPITNKAEFEEVYEYLIETAVKRLKISRHAAYLRIEAIRRSGIVTQLGPPDGKPFQIGIDVAMRIPQLGEKET